MSKPIIPALAVKDVADCGVYLITNIITGKVYVGSSIKIANRCRQHFNALLSGRHVSRHMQLAWNKYGPNAFTFERLLLCRPADLLLYEQTALDYYRSANRRHGYNTCPTAGNPLGVKHSDEAKAKMSAAKRGERHHNYGKPLPEQTRLRISAGNSGKVRTPEMRKKNGAAHQGKALTPEHKAKISAKVSGPLNPMFGKSGKHSPNFGKPCSAETKAKISAANTGKRRSAETRAKLSALASGENHPFYGKRGPLSHNYGRKLTDEHKAKIAAGVKRARAKQRGG